MRLTARHAIAAAAFLLSACRARSEGDGTDVDESGFVADSVVAFYPVDLDRVRRYAAADSALREAERRDPRVSEWRQSAMMGPSGFDAHIVTAALDSTPAARQAIEGAGIRTADYVCTYQALSAAVMVYDARRNGFQAPMRVNPATLRLVQEHGAEVRAALHAPPDITRPGRR